MPDQPLEARVLTVPEAATLLRCATSTLYGAIDRGEVPAVRIGRRIVVPGAALARLLNVGATRTEQGLPVVP